MSDATVRKSLTQESQGLHPAGSSNPTLRHPIPVISIIYKINQTNAFTGGCILSREVRRNGATLVNIRVSQIAILATSPSLGFLIQQMVRTTLRMGVLRQIT